jgi:hypothetical protein
MALTAAVLVSSLTVGAAAKTNPAGQTVETVLFYVTGQDGKDILVSKIPVSTMEADMASGVLDQTNHNYSLLDRYVTTVHQEAQGMTVAEFVDYAQSKSTVQALRDADLSFAGEDQISFWEIDQTGFDSQDTYTYNDLYGVARYNFPLLYKYWNYRTQDYYDPEGKMSRDEVIDYIFANGEQETVLLSVRAFSQRYMVTEEKYDSGDYNMENYFLSQDLLDNERTIRVMKPMTEEELRSGKSTASDTRYWVANLRLTMAELPDITAQGEVAAPTATLLEDDENYYISFQCDTDGATILYNANLMSPSYTPCCTWDGSPVVISKADVGTTITMTCRAVKEGWSDAGVVTLTLDTKDATPIITNPYSDVSDGAWYKDAVLYVTNQGLFQGSDGKFMPTTGMNRAMFITVVWRLSGSPKATTTSSFTDVSSGAWYKDALDWAVENGVTDGIGDGKFGPNNLITREQVATMLLRYEKVIGGDTTATGDLSSFTDANQVSSYAQEGMAWAVGHKIINGDGNRLKPKNTATRAEVAQMMKNYLEEMK